MNRDIKIAIALMLVLIVFLLFMGLLTMKYIEEMTSNPFVYGAKKFSQANGYKPFYCSCFIGENSFTFDTEGVYIPKTVKENMTRLNVMKVNWTNVKVVN